jgi:hypothetical protein
MQHLELCMNGQDIHFLKVLSVYGKKTPSRMPCSMIITPNGL